MVGKRGRVREREGGCKRGGGARRKTWERPRYRERTVQERLRESGRGMRETKRESESTQTRVISSRVHTPLSPSHAYPMQYLRRCLKKNERAGSHSSIRGFWNYLRLLTLTYTCINTYMYMHIYMHKYIHVYAHIYYVCIYIALHMYVCTIIVSCSQDHVFSMVMLVELPILFSPLFLSLFTSIGRACS